MLRQDIEQAGAELCQLGLSVEVGLILTYNIKLVYVMTMRDEVVSFPINLTIYI